VCLQSAFKEERSRGEHYVMPALLDLLKEELQSKDLSKNDVPLEMLTVDRLEDFDALLQSCNPPRCDPPVGRDDIERVVWAMAHHHTVCVVDASGPASNCNGNYRCFEGLRGQKMYRNSSGATIFFKEGWKMRTDSNVMVCFSHDSQDPHTLPQGEWNPHVGQSPCRVSKSDREQNWNRTAQVALEAQLLSQGKGRELEGVRKLNEDSLSRLSQRADRSRSMPSLQGQSSQSPWTTSSTSSFKWPKNSREVRAFDHGMGKYIFSPDSRGVVYPSFKGVDHLGGSLKGWS